jgi:hypothetical protein
VTYHITTYPFEFTLVVDVESNERAFDIAQQQWDDTVESIIIERIPEDGWSQRWRLTWPESIQIESLPVDICDVGYHFVSALINGDVSGIDAEDEHHLEEFIAQYPDCVFDVPDADQSFAKCEVTGKYNNCVRVKVFAR